MDATGGELVVDRAMVDLGTLTWTTSTTSTEGKKRFTAGVTGIKGATSLSSKGNMVCETYETVSWDDTYSNVVGIGVGATSGKIVVYDESMSAETAANFKAAMSGVKLCYELATPLTYQLTGQDIITLVGDNYIWYDSGDVTITESQGG